MKKLSLSSLNLEFESTEEKTYRQSYLSADAYQNRLVILIFILTIVTFTYIDYVLYAGEKQFYILMAVRILIIFFSTFVFLFLKNIKDETSHDYILFLWTLLSMVSISFIVSTRPEAYHYHQMFDILVILASYLFLLNRPIFQIIPAIFMSISVIFIEFCNSNEYVFAQYFVAFGALISANFFGFIISMLLHQYRRSEYLNKKRLQDQILTIKEYSKREEEFSQYTNHELRTPLFIIQASLDSLNVYPTDAKTKKIIKRALKASKDVNIISTALLYLARESNNPIKKTKIDAKVFIQNIIDDHMSLTLNKNIKVQSNIHITELTIEEELFFVILSNLIKNAFQHTQRGDIKIELSAHSFSIINSTLTLTNDPCHNHVSFAIGLKLVNSICEKSSFDFKIDESHTEFIATLTW